MFRTSDQPTLGYDETRIPGDHKHLLFRGAGVVPASWERPAVQTLSDQVARAILKRIATGDMRPGDKLPSQRDLAVTFDVGMSVIREALQRLQALQVVDAGPGGNGTTIRSFRWIPLIYDPSLFMMAVQHIGVADLWEARHLLEGQAARLAVRRATDADLARIGAIIDRAGSGPADHDEHYALNREFHLAVAQAARNAVVADLVAPLLDVRVGGTEHRFTGAVSEHSWDAHRRIFDALAARDEAAVDAAIAHHFEAWPPIALDEIERMSDVLDDDASRPSPGRRQ